MQRALGDYSKLLKEGYLDVSSLQEPLPPDLQHLLLRFQLLLGRRSLSFSLQVQA